MQARLIFGASIFAALLPTQAATQSLQVTDVRFWSLDGITRVAIETTGEFTFKSDRVPNPDRLFFDIIGAKPKFGGHKITVKPVNDKLLKRIRIAENVPGVTRVVLDLESAVEFQASQLGNPYRLIVELRQSAQAPMLTSANTSPPLPSVTLPSPMAAKTAAPVLEKPRVEVPVTAPDLRAAAMPLKTVLPPPPVVTPTPSSASAARKLSADGSRSLTRALGLKINRVVIDPGHGGHDQGTSGPSGLLEKDLVLDVALRLGKMIEERMGSEVIYTRSDDTFVPLEQRTAIANEKKADLFLSIHANSSPAPRVAGIETYYLNFTSSAEALDVAARENASSQKSVYELSDLVQSIAKHEKIEESREFAQDIQSALQSFEIRYSPTAKDRGIRKAPFVVLIGAQMPSVLAEIGFLSNGREETLLSKPDHRQKLAEALYRGVTKYTQTLSHFELTKRAEKPADVPKNEEFSK